MSFLESRGRESETFPGLEPRPTPNSEISHRSCVGERKTERERISSLRYRYGFRLAYAVERAR